MDQQQENNLNAAAEAEVSNTFGTDYEDLKGLFVAGAKWQLGQSLKAKTHEELLDMIHEIEKEINQRDDGFVYIVRVANLGMNSEHRFSNQGAALKFANRYNGDNGIAKMYTTNPGASNSNHYNEIGIYLIESVEEYEKWKTWTRSKAIVNQLGGNLTLYTEEKHAFDEFYKGKIIKEPKTIK